VVAYVIDGLVLVVLNLAVGIILGIIGIAVTTGTGGNISTNLMGSIIYAFVGLAVSGAYFVYLWTNQRATVGMKVLNLQIGNAPEGSTLTTEQAIRRWLALGAIFSIAQVLNPLPLIGLLIGLAAFAWVIFLLYTTATSPTKQGWHDKFANTMVVKAVGGTSGGGQPRR
jgi:uncharacterized RDD family membrane protein YckC